MTDDTLFPNFGQLNATAKDWSANRPVRIVMMGDFSAGAPAGRLETGADLARRKMFSIDFDSFETVLERLDVRLAVPLGNDGGIELEFNNDLDDFHPDEIYDNADVFDELYDLSGRVSSSAAEIHSWSEDGKQRASRAARKRSRSGAPAADAKLSDFAGMTGEAADVDTDADIDELVRSIVGPLVKPADAPDINSLTDSVDEALSDAMRAVLHNGEFQNLESLWRGLDMLFHRIDTSTRLQVLLLDMSAEEFAADLSRHDDLTESGLYSLLVDKPSEEEDGGVSMICGLYQFEAAPTHIELLGRMAKVASYAGATFVTAMAGDTLMNRKEEPHPLVMKGMEELRALPAASNLALMAPRFMLRYPYGKRSDPISEFEFEEFTPSDGLRGMLWGHPAFLATCALAGSGGKNMSIGDLPFYYMVDSYGDQIALPCTERLINTDKATQLSQYGISSVMAYKGQPEVRLAGLKTLNGQELELKTSSKPVPEAASVAPAVAVAVAAVAKAEPETEPEAVEPPSEVEPEAVTAEDSSSDTELDDLLAGFDDDDSTASDDASGTSEDDGDGESDDDMDDLDDLLASFGDDDDDSDDDDDEMDSDLADLLASLD